MAEQKLIEYAERVMALPGSPIRALLSSARADLPLDLGGGIPDPALFPRELMAGVADNLLSQHSALVLQYAPTEGVMPLRERIAQRLEQRGCQIAPDQVLVTHGSQHALAAVAALLTSPTRSVALEQPVYPGAEQAFALAEAPRVTLPVTENGWDFDALSLQKPAAIYVIANHQNPTGRRASREQRERMVAFANASAAFVIEDDAYGELDFNPTDTQIRIAHEPITAAARSQHADRDHLARTTAGTSSRPLIADLPKQGILIGTYSKTLCPGLRVGWIAAPRQLIDPLVRILQASSLQPGTFAQHLALGVVERLDWSAHLDAIRGLYAHRAASLRTACAELGLTGPMPEGGFFLWLRVPGNAQAAAERAAQAGVLMIPERAFRNQRRPGPDQHLRLAFTRYLDRAEDRAALRRAFAQCSM